jgi:hypothetical protein
MPVGITGVDGCSGHTWQQTTWPQHWQPSQVWLGSLWLVMYLYLYGGTIQRPVSSVRAFVATDNSVATIHDGASNLGEGDGTAGIAHCNDGQEGVRCKARDDVGISGSGWQLWEIKSASVR